MNRLVALLIAFLALLASPLAAQTFPDLSGRVVDAAEIISPETEAQLTADLEALEERTQRQMVVATVPSLDGYVIEDYGYRLGREWGLGDAERNDGALLLVAPNERKVRIEVGYGLEGILTDAYASTIIQQNILPSFRDGDMEGGIVSGTAALTTHLGLSDEQARAIVAERREIDRSEPIWVLPLLMAAPGLVILIFVITAAKTAGRTHYRTGGVSGTSISTYSPSSSSWSSSGSSFSSGSSSSSFSGGGGSFGGGGASGSW